MDDRPAPGAVWGRPVASDLDTAGTAGRARFCPFARARGRAETPAPCRTRRHVSMEFLSPSSARVPQCYSKPRVIAHLHEPRTLARRLLLVGSNLQWPPCPGEWAPCLVLRQPGFLQNSKATAATRRLVFFFGEARSVDAARQPNRSLRRCDARRLPLEVCAGAAEHFRRKCAPTCVASSPAERYRAPIALRVWHELDTSEGDSCARRARVAKLADAQGLGSCPERGGGSSPPLRTTSLSCPVSQASNSQAPNLSSRPACASASGSSSCAHSVCKSPPNTARSSNDTGMGTLEREWRITGTGCHECSRWSVGVE